MHVGRDPLRTLFGGLALSLLAVCVALALAELGVRGLQAFGILPRVSSSELFPMPPHGARLVRSQNPELGVEWDTGDPLINSGGFRGAERSLRKPPGTFRIVALGDSVTYGLGLPTEETFTSRLESRLNRGGGEGAPRYEVLNLGVNGYGIPQELAMLRSKGVRYEPDLVLLGFVLNDFMPLEVMFYAIDEMVRLRARIDALGRYSQLTAFVYYRAHVLRERRGRQTNLKDVFGSEQNWAKAREAFAGFGRYSREADVPVVVVIFPFFEDLADYDFLEEHRRVHQEATAQELLVLDLLEEYRAHLGQALTLTPTDVTHPNALGHEIAAERIHAHLVEHDLLGAR
jgi:lysophospholipase L1-like esterase